MKKLFTSILALTMMFSLTACSSKDADTKSEGVMTYEEYQSAQNDDEVVLETYVQAKQSWWKDESGVGRATVYTQDKDGAYFLYNMECSEEDYAKLVEGQKIKVTGYKAEWAGEVEVADATFEVVDGSYIAEPVDVTKLLGTDELITKQNQKVSFKGLTVTSEAIYNWDGSGSEGSDLYFGVSVNDAEYTFVVESYLCDKDSAVYKDIKNLKVGDTVDLEGFLYWYEGVNPHITAVTVK